MSNSFSNALQDFGNSFLIASEIEFIDLRKMKKEAAKLNLPISFFVLNITIDQLLRDMKEAIPDRVPPIREFKKTKEK